MCHRSFWLKSGQLPRLSFHFIVTALIWSAFYFPAVGACEEQTAYAAEERQLEDLTKTLVRLSSQYTQADLAARVFLLPQLQELASTRFQQLAALAESDPQAVVRVALPDALRSILPSELQEQIETSISVEGKLEVLYQDTEGIGSEDEQLRYFLHVGNERLALSFVVKPTQHLQTGTFVRASGLRVAESLVVESGASDLEIFETAVATVTGPKRALVVLVNFSDAPAEPYSVATAQNIIFQEVNNFFLENSFNKVGLSGDVYGWYTIQLTSNTCSPFEIRDAANTAAAAHGVDLSSYAHFIYAFPQNACGFSGSGTIGGTPTYMWINGPPTARVIAHEFGHNLGLYHSHSWECGPTSISGTCSSQEYGDTFDVMGDTDGLAHFNAFQKERMGWLPDTGDGRLTVVETSGTYLLSPYESPGSSNPQALKVLKSVDSTTGKKSWYYLERRQAIGFDSWLSGYNNIQNGVLIHTGSESSGNSSYLLDMTPDKTVWWEDWNDPALTASQSFTDPEAGVTIRTLWANNTGAAVAITLGSVAPETPSCVRANPTIALSPTRSQWVSPGSKVIYTLQVTNTDSDNCPASTFALRPTILRGWKTVLGSSTLTVSPGNQASTSLSVTSPSVIADGFYPVEAEVNRQEGASAASIPVKASATYAITSELQVALAPVQVSYLPGQTALTPIVSAQVLFAQAPLANVKVTFSLLRPNGRTVKKTAVTGTDGVATIQFLLKGKDLGGVYQLSVTGKQKKALLGAAATTFTVQ